MKDSQIQYSEIQTSLLPQQFQLTKITHERDYYEKQFQFIQEEYQIQTNEYRNFKSESSVKTFQLESKSVELQKLLEDSHNQNNQLKVINSPSPFKLYLFPPLFFCLSLSRIKFFLNKKNPTNIFKSYKPLKRMLSSNKANI